MLQVASSPEVAFVVSSRVARWPLSPEESFREYRCKRKLEEFIERQPNTAYERVHLPSGSRQRCHVAPEAALDALGAMTLTAEGFARRWSASKLLELVNQWNRIGGGVWQYVALPDAKL